MGTAEIPNVILVIIFTVIALGTGVLIFSMATASPSFYIKVPAAAALTGVALFSTSMVVTCLADLPLWLAVLISLVVGALVAYWSIERWEDQNFTTLSVQEKQGKKAKDDQGTADQPLPAAEE
ncbi:hypothetical protein [Micromonospora sp. KC721]|uniref:hypothetical protein n=1 Tax=Micromonospora sp. KC721 TaxID=2530380 RepID=UPI00104BBFA5|nr:hypothetical protein [Micromonospora sp. KC721]TDB80235.1 hypothetical protein E1182_09880 [Micromonospora sp. KC721]